MVSVKHRLLRRLIEVRFDLYRLRKEALNENMLWYVKELQQQITELTEEIKLVKSIKEVR